MLALTVGTSYFVWDCMDCYDLWDAYRLGAVHQQQQAAHASLICLINSFPASH